MNIFDISSTDENGEVKFLFTDDNCTILVDDFDFTQLDHGSNTYSMNVTIVKRSKITNFQFKKKLKRTMDKLLHDALENAIRSNNDRISI